MTRSSIVLALAGLALATVAHAEVYGSNPTVNLGGLDTCPGCIFPYIDFPSGAAGQSVTSYSFYVGTPSGNDPVIGNEITPLLFEESGSNFTIIGIGTTQTITAVDTTLTFPFGLVSGTATVVDGNTFFGYVDGNPSGATNYGSISMNYPTGPGPGNNFSFPTGPITISETLPFLTYTGLGQNTRTYSLDVTTPEPGFYAVFGAFAAGLIGLLVATRRRKIA